MSINRINLNRHGRDSRTLLFPSVVAYSESAFHPLACTGDLCYLREKDPSRVQQQQQQQQKSCAVCTTNKTDHTCADTGYVLATRMHPGAAKQKLAGMLS